jgi:hypothetical protein
VDTTGGVEVDPSATPSNPERRARRVGRPRGPERVALTVRILAEHDRRLTFEVERQGLSPQYLVERALAEYFSKLDEVLEHEHG